MIEKMKKEKSIDFVLASMRDDASLLFCSKEEMGLYLQIADGFKQVITNKLEENFAEE